MLKMTEFDGTVSVGTIKMYNIAIEIYLFVTEK